MSDTKRRFLGLFRSKSTTGTAPKREKSRDSRDSRNERERRHRRDRHSSDGQPRRTRSRPERSHPSRSQGSRTPASFSEPGTESRRPSASARATPLQPLIEWPPKGFSRGTLSQGKAMEWIASGVPVFKGRRREIAHTADEYYNLYASSGGNGRAGTDRREVPYEAFNAQSFRIQGPGTITEPWESLEQPSMHFCYGTMPGTITLNYWVGLSGNMNPGIELRDTAVKPREVELAVILERLIYLENGFEEDYEDLMYKNLYGNLLRDPDKYVKPHRAMERQISDLIVVLSKKDWTDFSRPENQVVAKFFANASYTDKGRYKTFFHQLLLSMELDLRIQSKFHTEYAKEKLLSQLPPCIAWDLALARKWRECMSIEKFKTGGDPEQIRFHLKAKKSQVKALRKFARAMKWPNLVAVDDVLKDRDPEKPLEDRSSDAMSYFTGMILPGVTLPWLVMNSLIDCDSGAEGNDLAALTHMFPQSGFQYRSTTYWSVGCIIGKVIAPTCGEVGGWVGPARPAPDLSRSHIARIRQRKPKQYLLTTDVTSMAERSDPLGPPSDRYPVSEYTLLFPENDPEFIINTVRIEKLALKLAKHVPQDDGKPKLYDAAVQFAIDGKSWPLRLSYDVSFISAYPCSRGPHPLFFDYIFKRVRVDEMLQLRDWGGLNSGKFASTSTSSEGLGKSVGGGRSGSGSGSEGGRVEARAEDENERVLVVEAYGVTDNEVLARAWCSHWGLSAVVADINKTCIACAIREAYAACLNVVICIDPLHDDSD